MHLWCVGLACVSSASLESNRGMSHSSERSLSGVSVRREHTAGDVDVLQRTTTMFVNHFFSSACIAFRRFHVYLSFEGDLIPELYENALKKEPSNEDLLTSLFMGYVRIFNYKKQQQTAMKLHKLCPLKNPYYFWNVMSVVMQVCTAAWTCLCVHICSKVLHCIIL